MKFPDKEILAISSRPCRLRAVIISFFIITGVLFHFTLYGCVSQPSSRLTLHPSQLRFSRSSFIPPKPERVTLPNGLILYLMEDHEVPLITIDAMIRTGAVYEPEEKTGLAQITGAVMRTGGTEAFSPEELDEKLEYIGATMEMNIGSESASAGLSILKKDLEQGLALFSQVLRYPAFADDKVELERMKSVESIRRQNDEPIRIASREFKRKIYEADPRGRIRTIEGIERIKREDMVEFHKEYFFPNNIIMGISGDFEKEAMLGMVSKFFGDWKKDPKQIPPAPVPSQRYEREVLYAQRQLPQSTILLGHLCCPKNHPDFFPMEVLNFILGDGGFSARLMKEIRSDRGLAYSVGSFYRGAIDYGVFGAYAMTKPETTCEVIDLILDEIERIQKGVKPDELKWAKDSILNRFIFSFSSTAGLVRSYISIEYNNLPEDYLEIYHSKISSVTADDVKRAALTYLNPEKSAIVVVGDAGHFDKPLDIYGKVEEVDLTIY